ncbi:MAG: hydroxymethylglutaryl-CoA lyase [Alphaproteobacteria bacterium]|jgi:hydroxymethylglutaryl-CoA lyase|nr:hydroxymethylglutaryl-CoA lyase [Alphaproteobacteria bacterium]|tara:strand:+ start:308 stop:1270 length:963 start_codon:yes stop_codon:yes gene_type:complete
MSDLPDSVVFHEHGPREGFQIENQPHPLPRRVALIDAIAAAGVARIQAASFVNPKVVPTMADSDELFAAIPKRPGVRYTALWLNPWGFEQAVQVPQVDLFGSVVLYASNGFSLSNNNCTKQEARGRLQQWTELYDKHDVALEQVYVLSAFGCNFEGEVPIADVMEEIRHVVDLCREQGRALPRIDLDDSMSWAEPHSIRRRIGAVREAYPELEIGLHLHDSRGLGAACVFAALEMGVRHFDSSIGGLGGCPFARLKNKSAAGNICTEDMVHMCHELGIETGIDLDALIEAAQLAEDIVGRPLMGRVMHAGSLAEYRAAAG